MSAPSARARPRLVGINHVALEVGDIEEALAFYGRLFEFSLRGRSDTMAFIDIGDQFIALSKGRTQASDEHRHFGLVVDDRAPCARRSRSSGSRSSLAAASTSSIPGATASRWSSTATSSSPKRPRCWARWRSAHLQKSEHAVQELAAKGIRFP